MEHDENQDFISAFDDPEEVNRRLAAMSREERAEWADEALNRINYILADPTLSDDVRQQTEEGFSAVKLMLAGMALSTWTPRGMWRKAVFLAL